MPVYFEFAELPCRQHFVCDRLRATLSTDACGDRWKAAGVATANARWITCKNCRIGARHAGAINANPSPFRAVKICARCHLTASRLIAKHLCISCYNRQREQVVGKNAKGTRPVKLAPLHRRSISYVTGGTLKSMTVERSLDAMELIVAVLRDEACSVQFGWQAQPGARALQQIWETGG
ncbi:hypothetical protein RI103_14125 [Paraburkholderia sp. FT54]|uniref:hypothetical protein n=1 Tax=Paraburkholderia sp. FT54 TaxID=3074437 RepID=UPI0028772AAD|nr:hypothetical protein [Paraburkholderia sp. FT54]WNC88836.1 hypothetical protein RI103_14125 [Paraburkholderia sp. FT54]